MMCTYLGKERQRLTKSRRTTVAASKSCEGKGAKMVSSSSDMESSETESDVRRGCRTAGRHGNNPAAAASVATTSLAATFVSPCLMHFFINICLQCSCVMETREHAVRVRVHISANNHCVLFLALNRNHSCKYRKVFNPEFQLASFFGRGNKYC